MPGRRHSTPASLVGSGTATAFPTFVHSPGPSRRELTIEVAALNSATYGYGLPFLPADRQWYGRELPVYGPRYIGPLPKQAVLSEASAVPL